MKGPLRSSGAVVLELTYSVLHLFIRKEKHFHRRCFRLVYYDRRTVRETYLIDKLNRF